MSHQLSVIAQSPPACPFSAGDRREGAAAAEQRHDDEVHGPEAGPGAQDLQPHQQDPRAQTLGVVRVGRGSYNSLGLLQLQSEAGTRTQDLQHAPSIYHLYHRYRQYIIATILSLS